MNVLTCDKNVCIALSFLFFHKMTAATETIDTVYIIISDTGSWYTTISLHNIKTDEHVLTELSDVENIILVDYHNLKEEFEYVEDMWNEMKYVMEDGGDVGRTEQIYANYNLRVLKEEINVLQKIIDAEVAIWKRQQDAWGRRHHAIALFSATHSGF